MVDVFSDVLRLIRLKSCVYFAREFWSPWAMRLDGGSVAQFHAVIRGQCVVEAAGQEYQGAPGDVFLFPKCEPHVIADAEGRIPVAGRNFMESLDSDAPLFSKGTTPTQLICGHYEYRNDIEHPLIEELAPVVHLKSLESFSPETFHSVLPSLIRELRTESPGATVVTEKLAEVLLVQVIRAHFVQEKRSLGFMAGLFDSRLARAFQLIHAKFEHRLTLDDLASAAGMSRSAFALHFKTVVGTAPISYLALWRMCIAHDLLQTDGMTVSQAAIKVGYDSEIAFGRAFKRHFDRSPASIRRRPTTRMALQ